MKFFQLIVFSLIICMSSLGYASLPPILDGPTPTQSYESIHSPRAQIDASKITSNDASKVTTPMKLESKPNPRINNALQSQINTLSQATLLYQQETNQKIETLTSQYQAIHEKLQNLTQAMLLINQQLSTLSHQQKPLSQKQKPASDSDLFKYLAFSFTVMLTVLLGVLISRQKKLTL